MKKYLVSTPSHLRAKTTTRRIMSDVIIALLPATIAGIILFGIYSLAVVAISVATAVITEFIYLLVARCGWRDFKAFLRDFIKQFDFTSVITGLLLALCLPVTVSWYIPFLSSIFAVAAAKMLFGGTGKNIVNPAATGRVFAAISFSIAVASSGVCLFAPIIDTVGNVVSGATPLNGVLSDGAKYSLLDLFLGTGIDGTIGETCKIALIAGGVYLVIRKVIKWWWPCLYIVSAGFFAAVFGGFDFSLFLPSILSGGLLLGAIFMATDYSTSPKAPLGKIIYFIFLGIITAALRQATGMEVVSYCIMLGNFIVPLIDIYVPRRPFGYIGKKKKEAVK